MIANPANVERERRDGIEIPLSRPRFTWNNPARTPIADPESDYGAIAEVRKSGQGPLENINQGWRWIPRADRDFQEGRQESANRVMGQSKSQQVGSTHDPEANVLGEMARPTPFVRSDLDVQLRHQLVIEHIAKFSPIDAATFRKFAEVQVNSLSLWIPGFVGKIMTQNHYHANQSARR
ncbi:MAG TPA: hypothetical protein VHV55_09100 [Pirellulales bacterium]|nr:hypothetical protein [Pirellulales bacterium]